jgi:hypothetical protein
MFNSFFVLGALYLAVPQNLTPEQEKRIVAALAAANDVKITAVEVKDEGPKFVIVAEPEAKPDQIPCCPPPRRRPPPPPPPQSYSSPPEERWAAPFFTMSGGGGPVFFITGGGVKLIMGSLLLQGEFGLSEAEGIFGDRDDDIYPALGGSAKIDPLAATKFPVRPTAGYRYFHVFVDKDVFDREFNIQGWMVGITATVFRGDHDTFELYVDGSNVKVENEFATIRNTHKKTVWVAGFAYTF